GQNTIFTATAAGSGTLQYQWFKNGEPLVNGGNVSAADTLSLSVTSASVSDEGDYTLVVSSGETSATSRPARLHVKSAPIILVQPAGGIVPVSGKALLTVEAEGAPTL